MIISIICISLQCNNNLLQPCFESYPCHLILKFLGFSFVETKHRTEIKINYKGAFVDLQLSGIKTVQRLTFSFELWSSKVDRWKYIIALSCEIHSRLQSKCQQQRNYCPLLLLCKSAMALLWSKWQIQQQQFDRDLQKLPHGY